MRKKEMQKAIETLQDQVFHLQRNLRNQIKRTKGIFGDLLSENVSLRDRMRTSEASDER